jgi:hypothetical protein
VLAAVAMTRSTLRLGLLLLWAGCSSVAATTPAAQSGAAGAAGLQPSAAGAGPSLPDAAAPGASSIDAASRSSDAAAAGRAADSAVGPGSAAGAGAAPEDAGSAADSGEPTPAPIPSRPDTFNVFSEIPMFGMYATEEPNYTPPPGVKMWSLGSWFVTRLSDEQKAKIGADLKLRVTYHAQCDNYDRIGGMFFLLLPPGEEPTPDATRTELARFITPFSSHRQGELATYVFEDADISVYAAPFADPARDVWIGIGGGSNPYREDACANTNMPDDYKAIGYKYSVDFVSSEPLTMGPTEVLSAVSDLSAEELPIEGSFAVAGNTPLTGRVSVIVSGHGAQSGGVEYSNTRDTLSVNGMDIGTFDTAVDCAEYERFSPEGNPGIFRSNTSTNPRNWCPGALVQPHTFPATLMPGDNPVRLTIEPARLPDGSYYATSITFVSDPG